MTWHSIRGTCLALAVAVLCSGCFKVEVPLAPGLMAIGRDADHLEVAVCQSMEVTGVSAGARRADENDWHTFWEGRGELTAVTGDIINTEVLRAVFDDADAHSPVLEDVRLEILLYGEQKRDNILGTFDIGEDGIPNEQWLQLDGSLTDEPCP